MSSWVCIGTWVINIYIISSITNEPYLQICGKNKSLSKNIRSQGKLRWFIDDQSVSWDVCFVELVNCSIFVNWFFFFSWNLNIFWFPSSSMRVKVIPFGFGHIPWMLHSTGVTLAQRSPSLQNLRTRFKDLILYIRFYLKTSLRPKQTPTPVAWTTLSPFVLLCSELLH